MSYSSSNGTSASTGYNNGRRSSLHGRVEPIRVAVRLRPLREEANAPLVRRAVWHTERAGNQQWVCLAPGALRAVQGAGGRGGCRTPPSPVPGISCQEGARFSFDLCFDGKTPNSEVFHAAARDVIRSCHEGVNATVLAYGQTNSGKTHSILGTLREPGVLPLAMHELFEVEDSARMMSECVARVSYFEIFNERVVDLLANNGENVFLPVKEDVDRGFYVQGLSETPVHSAEDVLRRIERGEERRRYAQTRWNEYSSRSHVLFTLTLERLPQCRASEARNGAPMMATLPSTKVSIVDLAGCESHKFEQSEDGRYINRSLFFLGEVISRLCSGPGRTPRTPSRRQSRETTPTRRRASAPECFSGSANSMGTRRNSSEAEGTATPTSGGAFSRSPSRSRERADFIPYRDSKLTRILRSSLGGNAVTLLLVTIHPSFQFIEQSMTSLRFAIKARTVENVVSDIGPRSVDEQSTIDAQQKIIEDLQQKLRTLELQRGPQRVCSPEPNGTVNAEMWQQCGAKGMPSGDFKGYIDQFDQYKFDQYILAQFRGLRHELEEKEQQLAAKTRLLSEREMQLGQLREQLEAGTGMTPGPHGNTSPPTPHGVPAASDRAAVLGASPTVSLPAVAAASVGAVGSMGPTGPPFADTRRLPPSGPHGVPSVRERAQGPAAIAAARIAAEEIVASVPVAPPAPAAVPEPGALGSIASTTAAEKDAATAATSGGQAVAPKSTIEQEPTAFQQVQSRAEDIVCLRSSQRYVTRQQMPMTGTAPAASVVADPSPAVPPSTPPPTPLAAPAVADLVPLAGPPLGIKLIKSPPAWSPNPADSQADPDVGSTKGMVSKPVGDAGIMSSAKSKSATANSKANGLGSVLPVGGVRAVSSTAPATSVAPEGAQNFAEEASSGTGRKSQKELVEKLLYLAVMQINSVKTGGADPADGVAKEAAVAKPGVIAWEEPQGGFDSSRGERPNAGESAAALAPSFGSRSGSADGGRNRPRSSPHTGSSTPPLAVPVSGSWPSAASPQSTAVPLAQISGKAGTGSRSWDTLIDWRWSSGSREDAHAKLAAQQELPPPSNPNVEGTPRKEAALEPAVDFVDLEITRRTTPPQPFGIGRPAREFNHARDASSQAVGLRRRDRT